MRNASDTPRSFPLTPFLWVAGLVAADQWLKWLVRARLAPGESVPLLPGGLHLTHVQNTGAAFGLFRNTVPWLIAVSVTVILVLAWSWRQERRSAPAGRGLRRASLLLIIGGAAGNLIDRLAFGHVVDFIDLRVWPVFNLADSAITIGIALLCWTAWRQDAPRAPHRGQAG